MSAGSEDKARRDQEGGVEQFEGFQRRPACGGLSSSTQLLVGSFGAAGILVVVGLVFWTGWSFGTQLLIGVCGSMGILLVVSYVIHWMQVIHQIQFNKESRKKELEQRQHKKASDMMSILVFERETRSYIDRIPMHQHDEYGINML